MSNCETFLLSFMQIENDLIVGYAVLRHKLASKAGFLSTAIITTLHKFKAS